MIKVRICRHHGGGEDFLKEVKACLTEGGVPLEEVRACLTEDGVLPEEVRAC